MNHVVSNLSVIDVYVYTFNFDSFLSKWLSKVLKKEVVIRRDWLMPSSITMSDDEHIMRALCSGEDVFDVSLPINMKDEVQHVVDWLAELEQRDPRLFAKLDRITWKQAVEHSTRWHEALVRSSAKSTHETISFDDDCPVMFTHDDGYKWVWLKTDKARDDEGRIMGHCVGGGGYDHLSHGEGVFSLRNIDGRPHVTLELREDRIVQAMTKGNVRVEVGSKYSKHVDEFHQFMKPLLTLNPKQEGVDHIVWWNGDETWYLDGELHNESGPASINSDGSKEWYFNGNLHREDGPAIIDADGSELWFRHGEIHRDGGPASIDKDGTLRWYKNNEFHRLDGPAIEYDDGSKDWYIEGCLIMSMSQDSINYYKDGKLHREDGPAIEYTNGDLEWYVHGKRHRVDGPAVECADGIKEWFYNGKPHREDGPAAINSDGSKEWWYLDGRLHRVNAPAIVSTDGSEEWYTNGKLHREDGPSVIKSDGTKYWHRNGYLHREDGPAIVKLDRTQEWYVGGLLHREGGPAVIHHDGQKEWWVNGKRHREDGPAIEYSDGSSDWYENGLFVLDKSVFKSSL